MIGELLKRLRSIPRASIVVALSLVAGSSYADDHSNRMQVPNHMAMRIAGELFPEVCGSAPMGSCGIRYDDRRSCPSEFIVEFPEAKPGDPPRPKEAWVALDAGGKVVYVGSKKRLNCMYPGT